VPHPYPAALGVSTATRATIAELAQAMPLDREAFHNPTRGHSTLDYQSPVEFERLHTAAVTAA
jgi:hypothetical protein